MRTSDICILVLGLSRIAGLVHRVKTKKIQMSDICIFVLFIRREHRELAFFYCATRSRASVKGYSLKYLYVFSNLLFQGFLVNHFGGK